MSPLVGGRLETSEFMFLHINSPQSVVCKVDAVQPCHLIRTTPYSMEHKSIKGC